MGSVWDIAKMEEGTFVMSGGDGAVYSSCCVDENVGEHIFYNHFGIIKCYEGIAQL